MDITLVFGTKIWGSNPYETAKKIMSIPTYRNFKKNKWSRGEMDITRVFGTWIWGSSPYETARKKL